MLLLALCALTAVVRAGASARGACERPAHEYGAAAHDCCRARLGRTHEHAAHAAHDSEGVHPSASRAARTSLIEPGPVRAHAAHFAAQARGSSAELSRAASGSAPACGLCCVGSPARVPARAPAPQQPSGEALSRPDPAQALAAADFPRALPARPTQHAPPGAAPRHLLHNVFLI
jgi:hypothetical protein